MHLRLAAPRSRVRRSPIITNTRSPPGRRPAMESPFRKKRLGQLGLLAGFGLLLPTAGVADAAEITQSQPFSLFASPAEVSTNLVGSEGKRSASDTDSTTVTFDQFDPALGILTEIDIGLNSSITGFFTVSASPAELFGPVSAHADWDASGSLM